jgi:hypothetical protein
LQVSGGSMKIAGSLWWWFGQRLRDAGGVARESNR